MYNLDYLINNIYIEINKLGIDSNFISHPSYTTVLAHIVSLILDMKIEKPDEVKVEINNEGIMFMYDKHPDKRYKVEITTILNNTIRCRRIEEDKDTKEIFNISSNIDINNNVIIETIRGKAANRDVIQGGCTIKKGMDKKVYNSDGIMIERENKIFKEYIHNANIQNIKDNVIISIPSNPNEYEKRTYLEREMLDIAKVVYNDKLKNINYTGKQLIKGKRGLIDMEFNSSYDKDIIIHSLTSQEIDEMINKENKEVIREGLKKFIKDRTIFEYDSKKDNNLEEKGTIKQ